MAFKSAIELLEERLRFSLEAQGKSHEYLKQHLEKVWQIYYDLEARTHDLEVQVNLLTRLMTTIALENLGIDLKEFRRLIRRVEKELTNDSEIAHLESLFSLDSKHPSHENKNQKRTLRKKPNDSKKNKEDPGLNPPK